MHSGHNQLNFSSQGLKNTSRQPVKAFIFSLRHGVLRVVKICDNSTILGISIGLFDLFTKRSIQIMSVN